MAEEACSGEVAAGDCSDEVAERACSSEVAAGNCSGEVAEGDCNGEVGHHASETVCEVGLEVRESIGEPPDDDD